MEQYLDLLESYENHSNLSISYLFEYTTEGVLSNIGETLERAIIVVDQFAGNCKSLVEKRMKHKVVYELYKEWGQVYSKMTPEERKEYVLFRDYPVLKETDADYLFQSISNLDALFRLKRSAKYMVDAEELEKVRESYLKNIHSSIYSAHKDDGNNIYTATLLHLGRLCVEQLKKYDMEIAELRTNLFSLKFLLEQTEGKHIKDTGIAKFFEKVNAAIKQKCICMLFNIESFLFALKDSTYQIISKEAQERTRRYIKMERKGGPKYFEWVQKNAEYVKSIYLDDLEFKIYKLPVKNISCFNMNGYSIYVDEDFFNHSIYFQKAIIYHEIGHYTAGHFGIDHLPDENTLMIQMKKDIDRFKKRIRGKAFKHGSNELIYLLVELEADRYAASKVGKRAFIRSIKTHSGNTYQYVIPKNPDAMTREERLLIAYNKERMVLRTQLI